MGVARRPVGRTTSRDSCGWLLRATPRRAPQAPPARSGRCGGSSGGCSVWTRLTSASGPGCLPLRDRLPEDLRLGPPGPDFPALPFSSLYLTDDEFAAEIANRTMHGVLHLGWVEDGRGGHRGQLAVLVKPNGLLGSAYMAAIGPFRHLVVYPAMLRQIGRTWRGERSRQGRVTVGAPGFEPGTSRHPNRARYQAAPRPEADESRPRRWREPRSGGAFSVVCTQKAPMFAIGRRPEAGRPPPTPAPPPPGCR